MEYKITRTLTDELYHYGVLGMKWGVRRYQNPDGTLTEAGKRRANRKSRKLSRKNRRTMSDKELMDMVNRLRNENQLKELIDYDLHPGRAATKDFLKQHGKKLAGLAATAIGTYTVKQILSNSEYWKVYKNGEVIWDIAEAAKYIKPKK